MSETKFTPGRWYRLMDWYIAAESPDGQVAVSLLSQNTDDGNLIAASKDLYAACEKWLKFYDACVRDKQLGDEPGIPEMRAALSKARGEQ